MKFEDAILLFLESRTAQGCSAKTILWYGYHLRRYAAWATEAAAGAAWLRPETIDKFLASERTAGLSPHTVRARYVALKAFLDWLVKRELLTSSPMGKITRPKVPDHIPRQTKIDEFRTLLDSIPYDRWLDLRDRVIVQFLFMSGLRREELAGLKIADVAVFAQRITVRDGKGSKDRIVPFPETARPDLLAYLYQRPCWDGDDLFLSDDGNGSPRGVLTGEGVRQMLLRRCKKAGVRYLNPHSFRHGFAMAMLGAGAEMSSISTLMGHASVKTTEDVYAKWLINELQAAYNVTVKRLGSE